MHSMVSSRHFEGISTQSSDESDDFGDARSNDFTDITSQEATDTVVTDSGMVVILMTSAGSGFA